MVPVSERLTSVKEYYFSGKLREVNQLINAGKPIINMGIGSPDLKPPQVVIDAMIKTVVQSNTHAYQSYQGLVEFRQAIANFYQRNYNVDLSITDEILPLMGSKEGIMHISMAYLNAGDAVLIPNPGYPTYSSVAKLVGAKPIYYDLKEEDNWFPNLEAIEKEDLTKVKLMWVNYPHMPTGTKSSRELFVKLVAFAKKHQLLLVNDNAYSFILNQHPLSILAIEGAKEVAIELNSLSKAFNMAGWRVGMVLGAKKYINTILNVKSNMDSGMFYGIQQGAIEALSITENWFNSQNKIYQERRNLVWELADAIGCTYNKDTAGLFVWAKLPKGINAKDMSDKLLYNYNLFVTPGSIFGSNGEGYIRFSLCITATKIKEAIQRINNSNKLA